MSSGTSTKSRISWSPETALRPCARAIAKRGGVHGVKPQRLVFKNTRGVHGVGAGRGAGLKTRPYTVENVVDFVHECRRSDDGIELERERRRDELFRRQTQEIHERCAGAFDPIRIGRPARSRRIAGE